MAVKISALSKELNVPSEQIIEQLRKMFLEIEDENSNVTEKIASLVRLKFGGAKPEPKKKKVVKKKVAKKKVAKKEEKLKKTKEEKPEKKKKEPAEEKPVEEKTEEASKKSAFSPVRIIKRAEPTVEKAKEKKKEKPKEEKPKSEKKDKSEQKKTKKTVVKRVIRIVDAKPGEITAAKEASKEKSKKKKHEEETGKVQKDQKSAETTGFQPVELAEGEELQKIQIRMPVSIRDLSVRINRKANEIIQYLMGKGMLASINQDLDEDLARPLLVDFGYELEIPPSIEEELMKEHHDEAESKEVITRAPVVTFMGHVDHGKTSLLDYIRDAMVAKREKGGITQHIGAYKVDTEKGSVTFLDTPGHAAFTAMRARGANATDVVVLVVAADDGVMPQTKEAIDHAKAAGVPIVVAINKCDLAGANPDNVKTGLQKEGLASEDWGGTTVMVEVSAKTGEGINDLVEMLMLESELLELKANPDIRARGTVVESKKTGGQGVVATLLVKNGTLRLGDTVLCGIYDAKIKAMINDRGQRIEEAPPATPVEILGLAGVPEAGDEFFVVKDERKAKILSELKQQELKKKALGASQRITLEDLHSHILDGTMKELNVILKADVQGSVGALEKSLMDLSTDEVKVNVIHSTVGAINESDFMLAVVSNAVIIGFHIKIDAKADELAKNEKIDIHMYDVIYEAISDVEAAMEGLLEPEEKEVFQGAAEIREVFGTRKGKVAGCSVTKGVIHRKDKVRVKRGKEVVHEGYLENLKRFKDDVRDVKEGFECGMSVKGFNDIRKKDIIEAFIVEKVARRLDKKKG